MNNGKEKREKNGKRENDEKRQGWREERDIEEVGD